MAKKTDVSIDDIMDEYSSDGEMTFISTEHWRRVR